MKTLLPLPYISVTHATGVGGSGSSDFSTDFVKVFINRPAQIVPAPDNSSPDVTIAHEVKYHYENSDNDTNFLQQGSGEAGERSLSHLATPQGSRAGSKTKSTGAFFLWL